MTHRSFFIATLVLLLTAALTVPALAQEASGAAAEAPAETVSGAATLMLLIGAGAVLTVAGLTLMRENAKK